MLSQFASSACYARPMLAYQRPTTHDRPVPRQRMHVARPGAASVDHGLQRISARGANVELAHAPRPMRHSLAARISNSTSTVDDRIACAVMRPARCGRTCPDARAARTTGIVDTPSCCREKWEANFPGRYRIRRICSQFYPRCARVALHELVRVRAAQIVRCIAARPAAYVFRRRAAFPPMQVMRRMADLLDAADRAHG